MLYVCVYVRMYVCVCMYGSMYVCMYICIPGNGKDNQPALSAQEVIEKPRLGSLFAPCDGGGSSVYSDVCGGLPGGPGWEQGWCGGGRLLTHYIDPSVPISSTRNHRRKRGVDLYTGAID